MTGILKSFLFTLHFNFNAKRERQREREIMRQKIV